MASARWTTVSCVIRRAQKAGVPPGATVHTGASGPAARRASANCSAPSVSQAPSVAASTSG
ncbi:hypothetical protein GZL_04166 [Streptomyces sp. 769]|nr:hypothetical protein GZL_04166 [Streptomyces sp. 769]